MILNKARNSVREFSSLNDDSLFLKIFPEKIDGDDAERYLLERSFFRPRDIVQHLNLVIESFPNIEVFSSTAFKNVTSNYSKYLLGEVRNEMAGYFETPQIDFAISAIKRLNRSQFAFADFKSELTKVDKETGKIALELSRKLFEAGAFGNLLAAGHNQWSYRGDQYEFQENSPILLHKGLRRILNT